MKTICILGLGYIGLPTAGMFATHGYRVIGVDVNPRIVETLNNGGIHIEEAGLAEMVRQAISSGNLAVRSRPEPADAFIVAVPTPIRPDKTANMSAVTAATQSIVPHLRPGSLVILESTSPPGTTRNLVRSILETSGLKAGRDFSLAYSPERVLPGQILWEIVHNARVIGGIDPDSARAGRDLYASFVQGEIMLTDATTAEMVKLMENTFRDVNIALANEFALVAEKVGVDVWEAITIANHHPRVKILKPGPGVGGHCIAVDPWFLVESAPEQARLIRQARQVNDGMPDHVVGKVREWTAGIPNPVIACLGLTFKADVDDTRESPAVEVVERLIHAGYAVQAYDPHVSSLAALDGYLAHSVDQAFAGAHLAVLLVDHAEFRSLAPAEGAPIRRILDTRHCLDRQTWERQGTQIAYLGSRQE